MHFAKGHGTGNDFVLLPDPDGELPLPVSLIQALCDRRFGIGGDGVLRVVRSKAHPEALAMADETTWFMDYRNRDGSIAEMCGNGVRVFARYLVQQGWAEPGTPLPVATRAGVVHVQVGAELISVRMPDPVVGRQSRAIVAGAAYPGVAVDVGNPHLVCRLADQDALGRLDLGDPPLVDGELFDTGANVEFYALGSGEPGAGALQVRIRVYERGSGETLSCGTGACAVAAAVLRDAGREHGAVAVSVPGGELVVSLDGAGCTLNGPAVIVANGEVAPDWPGRTAL